VNLWQALDEAEALFESHEIESTRVEAELLLRYATGLERSLLYAELQQPLTDPASFWDMVKRRLGGEPTAYITHRRAFYGLEFYVDPRVLLPRQETELLVEVALEFARETFSDTARSIIADIGTGSGAVAVSLAVNLPQAEVYATDISPEALEVASRNSRDHEVESRVHLLQGDMLLPLPEPADMIVCNPPYVSDSEMDQLPAEIVRFEPTVALAGGSDGLDKIRGLVGQARGRVRPGGALMFEIGQGQERESVRMCREGFPNACVESLPDLAGLQRVVKVTNVGEDLRDREML
jgi:release factor glutamine methyltransferase